MDDSVDNQAKSDDPTVAAERPDRTGIDADSDNPKTGEALGTVTLGGGATPYTGVIAAPKDEGEKPAEPVDANDSTDPRGY
jgi:hypothetical protein